MRYSENSWKNGEEDKSNSESGLAETQSNPKETVPLRQKKGTVFFLRYYEHTAKLLSRQGDKGPGAGCIE